MAKYKPYDLKQTKMIPLSYADQIIEGSFEYALGEIVEEHLDLSVFDQRYRNDEAGRPAYDPRVLLKVVLYGYYKGIISSRELAEACRRNIIFMALSADSRPHFTTIASFVSELPREIVSLFRDVLLYASELGLIGKEHFAVDGCKLPSNASKRWSGTQQELEAKRKKLESIADDIVRRHHEQDVCEANAGTSVKDSKKAEHYRRKVEQIKEFLQQTPKKQGPSGNEQKSNLTDPDSAKMSSSRGVLQGYNGLAVVDDRAQIVVHAEAHGSGYEGHLLVPLIDETRKTFAAIGSSKNAINRVKFTADSGFHSKAVVAAVEQCGADAYIPDRDYRRREPAFASAARHKARDKKERGRQRRKQRETLPQKQRLFTVEDFTYDERNSVCVCPAGHRLYQSGTHMLFNGYRASRFKAPITACRDCSLRSLCLRYPERTKQRQLLVLQGREGVRKPQGKTDEPTERMRAKFDSLGGRAIYSRRMPTVEPVFANLQNKGMRRFTLRGRTKVNAQRQLFTMVHNIEKIARRSAPN
jgi:transposase